LKYKPPADNDALIDIVSNRRYYLNLDSFDPAVTEVMRGLDRGHFVPPGTHGVYDDDPVPIGDNQTCSQPSMVAAMATMLELRPGHRVLEVGTGCGYSAAVTARLISPGGSLLSYEIVPELATLAERNLSRFEFDADIKLVCGDGSEGAPGQDFDRIYLTAGVGRYFNEHGLLRQLAPGGILLYPEAHGQLYLLKKTPGGVEKQETGMVGFVFLKGRNSGYR